MFVSTFSRYPKSYPLEGDKRYEINHQPYIATISSLTLLPPASEGWEGNVFSLSTNGERGMGVPQSHVVSKISGTRPFPGGTPVLLGGGGVRQSQLVGGYHSPGLGKPQNSPPPPPPRQDSSRVGFNSTCLVIGLESNSFEIHTCEKTAI